jgi:hypothetical protein
MVLTRQDGSTLLYLRGRDVEEKTLLLNRCEGGAWSIDEWVEDVPISDEQGRVLECLWELGGEARAKDLSSKLGKSQQNTTNMLKRLIGEGLVSKAGRGIYRLSESGAARVGSVGDEGSVKSVIGEIPMPVPDQALLH